MGLTRHLGRDAERLHHETSGGQAHGEQNHADERGQPHPAYPSGEGEVAPPLAQVAGDRRGCGVGEEHHEPDKSLEDIRRHGERRESILTEVSDHRRIGQEEQGLHEQGAQGRDGEPGDVAVDACGGGHHCIVCGPASSRAGAVLCWRTPAQRRGRVRPG